MAAVSLLVARLHSLSASHKLFLPAALGVPRVCWGFGPTVKSSWAFWYFYSSRTSIRAKWPFMNMHKIQADDDKPKSVWCEDFVASVTSVKAQRAWPLGVTQRSQNKEGLASKRNNENTSENNPKPFPLNIRCHYRCTFLENNDGSCRPGPGRKGGNLFH